MAINDIVLLQETDFISDSRQVIDDNFLYLKNRINAVPTGPKGDKGDQGIQGFPGPKGDPGQDGGKKVTLNLGVFDAINVGTNVCPPYLITAPGLPDKFYMKAKIPPVGGLFQIDIYKSLDIFGTNWASIFAPGNLPTIQAGVPDWSVVNIFFPGVTFEVGQQLRVDVLYANGAQCVTGILTWKV